VSPVRYELGLYIPEDAILHSHRRENVKPYTEKINFLSTSIDMKDDLNSRDSFLAVLFLLH
jgi:hypothetical protein